MIELDSTLIFREELSPMALEKGCGLFGQARSAAIDLGPLVVTRHGSGMCMDERNWGRAVGCFCEGDSCRKVRTTGDAI